MESNEMTATIEQWITVRKKKAEERSKKAIVNGILQKVAEILKEDLTKEKTIRKMTFDINSKGWIVLIWERDNHSKSGREKWDIEDTKSKEGRKEFYKELEQYFKQYPGLSVWGKSDCYDGNPYEELYISVKEE